MREDVRLEREWGERVEEEDKISERNTFNSNVIHVHNSPTCMSSCITLIILHQ